MQPLVSMVVPCYNKVKYIEAFFRSVYEQKWDNIELILVNDGSTDGTRELIGEWEPRFLGRGYKVVIIDQENQGLPGAVKAGMLRASGKYFCTVDCDDELDPEYVSKMAGFLEGNPEYEWVACDYVRYSDTENGRVYKERGISRAGDESLDFTTQYFLYRMGLPIAAWVYMVRMSYLAKCGVAENFSTRHRFTQETPFSMPLVVGGGRLKVLPDKLYRYNINPSQMSVFYDIGYAAEQAMRFLNTSLETIETLDCDAGRKEFLRFIEKEYYYSKTISTYMRLAPEDPDALLLTSEYIGYLNESFTPSPKLGLENLRMPDKDILENAIESCLLGIAAPEYKKTGRLIAAGTLGEIGRRYLRALNGTPLEPDLLWDASAGEGSEIYGCAVTRPNYDSLSPGDTVLIFPRIERAVNEIKSECAQRGVTNFIDYYDVLDILSAHYFPQFYGECQFAPDVIDPGNNI